jgi:hypothetical protein
VKYEVRPYKPEDYYQIRFKGEDTRLLAGMGEVDLAKSYAKQGPAFSGFADGEIIACAGVVILWPGTGEAWCLVSPRVRAYPLFFHRATILHLGLIVQEKHLCRIQANVQKDFPMGHRWIVSLGFESEGDMPMYFGGLTFTRYAKIYNRR